MAGEMRAAATVKTATEIRNKLNEMLLIDAHKKQGLIFSKVAAC